MILKIWELICESNMCRGNRARPISFPAPSALAHIMLSVTGFTLPYLRRHASLSIISTATCSIRVAKFLAEVLVATSSRPASITLTHLLEDLGLRLGCAEVGDAPAAGEPGHSQHVALGGRGARETDGSANIHFTLLIQHLKYFAFKNMGVSNLKGLCL